MKSYVLSLLFLYTENNSEHPPVFLCQQQFKSTTQSRNVLRLEDSQNKKLLHDWMNTTSSQSTNKNCLHPGSFTNHDRNAFKNTDHICKLWCLFSLLKHSALLITRIRYVLHVGTSMGCWLVVCWSPGETGVLMDQLIFAVQHCSNQLACTNMEFMLVYTRFSAGFPLQLENLLTFFVFR